MAAFDLDVGVIYTHERPLMPRLLETMSASGRRLCMRLILVDNASADDLEPWCAYFPETRILNNARRLGYAANLNRILEASTARYTLLLNTDMYFDPRQHCLARMVAFMDSRPQCGVAGCRLYHADGGDAHGRHGDFLPCRWCWRGGAAWGGCCDRRSSTTSTPNTPPGKVGPATGFPVAS